MYLDPNFRSFHADSIEQERVLAGLSPADRTTSPKECIAMVLAGGKGTRLAALTTLLPKPAVPFGGRHRLIDFSLSNCYNSGIDTVGVLTSNVCFELDDHICSAGGNGLQQASGAVYALAPAQCKNRRDSYKGTANAIYENIAFVEKFAPEYVVILSGDHVYKMDYNLLLNYHKEKGADVTISVIEVPWPEAPRFGIMNTLPDGKIDEFVEKPPHPKSNLASMGVYVFSWAKLRDYLEADEADPGSSHDFGKNIIPAMLDKGEKLYAYRFDGYWKDVGTVESLFEAHMDLLANRPAFDLQEMDWPIYSTSPARLSDLRKTIGRYGHSLISADSSVLGEVETSVIFHGTYIATGAQVKNSVIMPGAVIGPDAYIEKAMIGPGAVVRNGCVVCGGGDTPVAVVGEKAVAFPAKRRLIFDKSKSVCVGA
ncbi:MAG TPA: glucose-1-phosphate adenylyltransferase [Methylomusa anaerophila]|uniref:Glucose-1-phosphate adenylyltransferase n=1 Tax=Methylomusa anaerophila TaxID=1930071 RepID=A0A348AJ47_9FIRM|nr:glucose-1-phosphate adenylyltransferase [Methylomusa anaerophila]BBB91095.1 glucose-1-phosphate adenylyltransferase [Methylomusa anaerophila]HML88972.1 glucose-1-phosphate adenylyltransferase [Methylomusa anaerophila]